MSKLLNILMYYSKFLVQIWPRYSRIKKKKLLQKLLKMEKMLYQFKNNDCGLAILDLHLHLPMGISEASDLGHNAESTSTNAKRSKRSNCKRMQQSASSYD